MGATLTIPQKIMATIKILQLSNTPENRGLMFANYSFLQSCGVEVEISRYNVVFDGEMEVEDLDAIYCKLQSPKMDGYSGRSLSVSDIVEMDNAMYYVDNYGFVKL